MAVAQEECSKDNNLSSSVTFPALSLTSVLYAPASSASDDNSTSSIETIRKELMYIFLQASSLQTSKSSSSFPQPSQLALARTFLAYCVTQSLFDESLAPTLGLKMRAHPESVLPLVEVILSSLVEAREGSIRKSPLGRVTPLIDGSSQLLTEGGGGANLLPSTIKHLKSSKVEMRWLAWRTLILLSKLSGETPSVQSAVLVTEGICEAITTGMGAMALTTSELRSGVYAALEGISNHILEMLPMSDGKKTLLFSEEDVPAIAKIADKVLSTLIGCLPKDKNSATSISTASSAGTSSTSSNLAGFDGIVVPTLIAKEVGYNAILAWMRLSKRILQTEKQSVYDLALDYLAEPVMTYSLKDGEFRFRIGSLVLPSSSSYLSLSLTGAGESSSATGDTKREAFVELLIVDLMEKKNIQKGLEAVVAMSVKKHATSDAVAQIDGALAIFLLVVYAHYASGFSLPSSAAKVIGVGANAKDHETSFLFSHAILETARTDMLVSFILHRTIALYCKVTSKTNGEANGNNIGGQPLVRVICKKGEDQHLTDTPTSVSAATRVLAICTANPVCVSTQSSTFHSSIHSSLKTVVTYSPASAKAADAILMALFSHANECSLRNEDARASLNETRSSREQFDPIDETFNKLPIGGSTSAGVGSTVSSHRGKLSMYAPHKGYDPSAIRSASNALLPRVADADAMWKGLLLSHAGTTMRSNRRQRMALVSHMLDVLKEIVVPFVEKNHNGQGWDKLVDRFAGFIALCAASSRFDYQCGNEKDYSSLGKQAGDGAQDKTLVGAGKKSTVAGVKKGSEGERGIESDLTISPSIHEAALSLITTLGGIAGSFDTEFDDTESEEKKPYGFAHKLCTQKLPPHLVSHLSNSMKTVKNISADDIALFRSPKGILFRAEGFAEASTGGRSFSAPKPSNAEKRKAVGRKGKGGGGFDSSADEEWERQVKKDLEKKKAQEKLSSGLSENEISPEEKELLNQQTLRREELSRVLRWDFPRALAAIRSLCESDIEVGNASLPIFGLSVIATVVSTCPALTTLDELQKDSFDTLATLASCVYEIDDIHAPTLARALSISFQNPSEQVNVGKCYSEAKMELTVSALPSPCAPAACSIFEINELGECLSGNSFVFLFPIIKAALTGPRNIPGCDAALTVLRRHCSMLAGDQEDAVVKPLRKEMASTVLELLSHDRSQTFVNPTPYEALIACYVTGDAGNSADPVLTAPEISPLLGEGGALGNENTRVAAMETLACIGELHPKLIKNNPLIESRIWLNCYDINDRIRRAARKAWLVANSHDVDGNVDDIPIDPPNKMYAVPLLPLLSHKDSSIASAAAVSLSYAMGMHPDSIERNNVKLCNTIISSFPAASEEEQPKASSIFPIQAPHAASIKPVKKVIDTGLKKKTSTTKKTSSVSTSLAKITGAPAPKRTAATKRMIEKTIKQERTLDQEALMGQFKTHTSVKKESAGVDSENMVVIRMGVLRAISSLTDSRAKVQLDLSVLKVLVGFLMAFGLADGNECVRSASRNAARDIVANYGSSEEVIAFFLPQFEAVLSTGQVDYSCLDPLSPEKVPKSITASDLR